MSKLTTTITDERIARIDRALDDTTTRLVEMARDRAPSSDAVVLADPPPPAVASPPVKLQLSERTIKALALGLAMRRVALARPGRSALETMRRQYQTAVGEPAAPKQPPIVGSGETRVEQFGLPWSTLKKQLAVVGGALAAGFGTAAMVMASQSAEAEPLPFELTSRGVYDYLESVPDGPERDARAEMVQQALAALPVDQADAIRDGAEEAAIAHHTDRVAAQLGGAIAVVDEKVDAVGAIAVEANEVAGRAFGLGVEANRAALTATQIAADTANASLHMGASLNDSINSLRADAGDDRREAHERDLQTREELESARQRSHQRIRDVDKRQRAYEKRTDAKLAKVSSQAPPATHLQKIVEKSGSSSTGSAATGAALRAHLKKVDGE